MESISGSLNTQISLGQMKPLSLGEKVSNDKLGHDQTGDMLSSFGNVLKEQMNEINRQQQQADEAVQTYAVGGDIELHNVIMATDKAEMSLQLATQIRNKLLMAYQEISRMPV